jgi:hypothetical protein
MDPKSVTVEFLDESLLPGLADLSVGIYGGDRDRLIGYLRQRFLAPYVAGRSVPLLGLDAERTVIASQTWPDDGEGGLAPQGPVQPSPAARGGHRP